jgi:membrane-associated phospholipid phosphatase
MTLHFIMAAMNWLADHRQPWLTAVMRVASFLGEVQGYILISTLVYVAFDKALAVRLSLLVALTMCLNHVLKISIKNPRPFVREGNFIQKWAVPPDYARDLAVEYSTPSGHAMAGSAFYSYLYGAVRKRAVRAAAVLATILVGASRPYLGVHYVEDILLGWAIGLCAGLFALRHGERIRAWWNAIPCAQRVAVAVATSAVFWAATISINGCRIDGQPRAFLGYAGTVTGIIIARPLELRAVNFDPRSSSVPIKILRFLLSGALSIFVLEGLGELFSSVADNYSMGGYVLQYIRYTALSVVSIFVGPWFFVRTGLARTASA